MEFLFQHDHLRPSLSFPTFRKPLIHANNQLQEMASRWLESIQTIAPILNCPARRRHIIHSLNKIETVFTGSLWFDKMANHLQYSPPEMNWKAREVHQRIPQPYGTDSNRRWWTTPFQNNASFMVLLNGSQTPSTRPIGTTKDWQLQNTTCLYRRKDRRRVYILASRLSRSKRSQSGTPSRRGGGAGMLRTLFAPDLDTNSFFDCKDHLGGSGLVVCHFSHREVLSEPPQPAFLQRVSRSPAARDPVWNRV